MSFFSLERECQAWSYIIKGILSKVVAAAYHRENY